MSEHEMVFVYSKIYKWRNLLAIIPPLFFILLTIPSLLKYGLNKALLFIYCFLLFAIGYFLFLHIQRVKSPLEIHVDQEKITGRLMDGRLVSIAWNSISEIDIKKLYKRKMITIRSKDKSKEIIFYDCIKGYDSLMQIIREHASDFMDRAKEKKVRDEKKGTSINEEEKRGRR